MLTKSFLRSLKQHGFVNVGSIALTDAEIQELTNLSRQAFCSVKEYSQSVAKHPDYNPPDKGAESVTRLPQQHPRIAEIMNKLLSEKYMQEILEGALGINYKIWQIVYRKSIPGDRGLYLHQDAYGETNLTIMLSSNPTGDGAPLFLSGSHLIKTRMKQWRIETPTNILRLLSPLFEKLRGKTGDVALFFNRTWHGRSPNLSRNTHDVILISFFPGGASFGFEGYGEWSNEFLDSIRGTKLGQLVDPSVQTRKLDDGRYEVLNSTEDVPFSLEVESGNIRGNRASGFKLILTIAILRFIFWFRPVIRLARGITGKIQP